MNTNTVTAIAALKTIATEQPTDTLMGTLLLLDAKGQGNLGEAERLVQGITSDVITERHGLNDAMDAILLNEDFEGTYTDALLICLAMVAA
jgi:hypothetical protein